MEENHENCLSRHGYNHCCSKPFGLETGRGRNWRAGVIQKASAPDPVARLSLIGDYGVINRSVGWLL